MRWTWKWKWKWKWTWKNKMKWTRKWNGMKWMIFPDLPDVAHQPKTLDLVAMARKSLWVSSKTGAMMPSIVWPSFCPQAGAISWMHLAHPPGKSLFTVFKIDQVQFASPCAVIPCGLVSEMRKPPYYICQYDDRSPWHQLGLRWSCAFWQHHASPGLLKMVESIIIEEVACSLSIKASP